LNAAGEIILTVAQWRIRIDAALSVADEPLTIVDSAQAQRLATSARKYLAEQAATIFNEVWKQHQALLPSDENDPTYAERLDSITEAGRLWANLDADLVAQVERWKGAHSIEAIVKRRARAVLSGDKIRASLLC
jgi:hypothetical protein